MQEKELFFVIPTYRLREVGETVEHYDEHFWRNGQAVPMIVFDDSSPANQEKYYSLLEQTKTHNELFVVLAEKPQLVAHCAVCYAWHENWDVVFGCPIKN